MSLKHSDTLLINNTSHISPLAVKYKSGGLCDEKMHTLNLEMTWVVHSSAGGAGVVPRVAYGLLQSP